MQKSETHVVAGILDVVESILKLFSAFGLIFAVFVVGSDPRLNTAFGGAGVFIDIPTLLLVIAVPFAILGVLGMVGGITRCWERGGPGHLRARWPPRFHSRYWASRPS